MNVFKVAYKVVRATSKEIYKGFGLKHLSDVTQYYVHPDNQSFKGTTTLCQPIGEAIILFASMLSSIAKGTVIGDYFVSDDCKTTYLDISIPEDYRVNQVVEPEIFRYRALLNGMTVTIAAYDENGRWVEGDMKHLHPLYKLLPVFLVLLGREMETNTDYRAILENFVECPVADTFVNLHEDFYQNHKMDDYEIVYTDLADVDTSGWHSYGGKKRRFRYNPLPGRYV
jgi:hypothetical protein